MFFSTTTTPQGIARSGILAGIAGALATMALLPYATALAPGLFDRIRVPLPAFLGLQFIQALVLFTFVGWAGLRLAYAAGLMTPDRFAPNSNGVGARSTIVALQRTGLATSIAAGCVTGLALLSLAKLTEPFMPATIGASVAHIALWKRLAASFYGGVAEELLCRLFLMSLLVWLARHLLARHLLARIAPVSSGAAWIGIVGAAVLFGMGHLPAAAAKWPLTTIVVMRIVMLNSAGGIVFGWLYWRRGLTHSMAAHFFADIVLHGIGGS